jgi:hypothetical protein
LVRTGVLADFVRGGGELGVRNFEAITRSSCSRCSAVERGVGFGDIGGSYSDRAREDARPAVAGKRRRADP